MEALDMEALDVEGVAAETWNAEAWNAEALNVEALVIVSMRQEGRDTVAEFERAVSEVVRARRLTSALVMKRDTAW
ncbi:hypothetical protein [Streptomyces sp. WG7]|uniref:hypothetical protein n=1 Tax=Streptomyces sp. WG7 TaxID=3417650 RepID=UPI003CF1B2BE